MQEWRNASVKQIKGIGEKTAVLFRKLNIDTVGDLIAHYPRTYVRYPAAKPPGEAAEGETAAVSGRITKAPVVRRTGSMAVTIAWVGAVDDGIEMVWFRMPYIRNNLQPGNSYVFYGKVLRKNGRKVMEQPAIYSREQYDGIAQTFLPVYALTGGISNNLISRAVRTALSDEKLFGDCLPAEIRDKYRLSEYNYAVRQIHFPDDMDTLIVARKRLVFDEFFFFILSMQYQKEKRVRDKNEFVFADDNFVETLKKGLPFELTRAQEAVLSDIRRDMRGPFVMQRLIQGDVGSGKTVLAFLAMADVAHNGCQSAIMAPTEVLARQHRATFE